MKILIVSPIEYGKLIDHVKWVKYLSRNHQITHISLGQHQNILKEENKTIQVLEKKSGNFIYKNFSMYIYIYKTLKGDIFDCIIVDYFPGCSMIKLTNFKNKVILDIRTATISDSSIKKKLRDLLINIESRVFDKITVITKPIGDFLKLPPQKFNVLPLGADKIISKNNNFEKDMLKLLYVGTLTNRDIHKTILAVKKYLELGYENISYTIIGYAKKAETEKQLIDLIKEKNLDNYINFIGKVNHDQLATFYEEHNIGISFIPMNQYFDLQPPTKTFEYIMNGLFCIATETTANKEIITEKNGLLVNDEVDSLCEAFIEANNRIDSFNSIQSANTLESYQWENIVRKYLEPLL